MSEFGRQAVCPHLELLNRIQASDHHLLVLSEISVGRSLAAYAVDRISDRVLRLPVNVRLPVDGLYVRHVENHAVNELLHHRDLLHGVALEDGAVRGGLRLEQWRRTGDRDRFGNIAEFELDVDTRDFGGTKSNALADEFLESRRLNRDAVIPRVDVRDIVFAFRVSKSFIHERRLAVGDGYSGAGHYRARTIQDFAAQSCATGGLSMHRQRGAAEKYEESRHGSPLSGGSSLL